MSEKTTGKQKAPSVYSLFKPSRCYNCDKKLEPGAIVKLKNTEDEREVLCQACAGLQNYVILPSGNAAATRLAKKHSPDHYVILKWSELWKTYERQGLLVQAAAIPKMEQELGKPVQVRQ